MLLKSEWMLRPEQTIEVLLNTLNFIDSRLVNHGARVAYIASVLQKFSDNTYEVDLKNLVLLSLFHDIGAYKTEEIDNLLQFDSENVSTHTVYGYLFIKNMSPIANLAPAILYHHTPFSELDMLNETLQGYAAYLHLADRIDVLLQNKEELDLLKEEQKRFDEDLLEIFFREDVTAMVIENLQSGNYHRELEYILRDSVLEADEALDYLRMLVYAIDFRSEYTVTHTLTTSIFSVELGRRLGLNKEECGKLYIGSLVHDLGKIRIPLSILEKPGALNSEEIQIMRKHVEITEHILTGLIEDELIKIACRHHEKLDGTGYPHGLSAEELTLSERIVAVADLVSALSEKRSYKNKFSKEKVITMLDNMSKEKKLGAKVCEVMINQYDEILEATNSERNPMMRIYEEMKNYYSLTKEEKIYS